MDQKITPANLDKARNLMDEVLQQLRQERTLRQSNKLEGARELSEAITCFETGCMWMIRSIFADKQYTPLLKLQPDVAAEQTQAEAQVA